MVSKCHTVTFCPEICVKISIFKVDVQSDHLETKCSWVKVSQGKNVTVDVSSGSKCHSGQNVGGHNVKASFPNVMSLSIEGQGLSTEFMPSMNVTFLKKENI